MLSNRSNLRTGKYVFDPRDIHLVATVSDEKTARAAGRIDDHHAEDRDEFRQIRSLMQSNRHCNL